jgi:hypothetical protein
MSDKKSLEDKLRAIAYPLVRGGFDPQDSIEEAVFWNGSYLFADDYDDETIRVMAARITQALLQAHYDEQQTWVYPTDFDRLSFAFEQLEKASILARHHYWCCTNCGQAEIADEIEVAKHAKGFVFYTEQDTEVVATSGILYLAFGDRITHKDGTVVGDIEKTLLVGQEIIKQLRAMGFEINWDGTIHTRIAIQNMDWKKRREPTNQESIQSDN